MSVTNKKAGEKNFSVKWNMINVQTKPVLYNSYGYKLTWTK